MSKEKAEGFAQEHLIEDIRSSETMIVDNLHKVKEILNEMLKMRDQYSRKSMTSFSSFKFIDKWVSDEMSKEDKEKYFSAYSCHELHLFLKKHDL
jgi:methionine aminopeptidase